MLEISLLAVLGVYEGSFLKPRYRRHTQSIGIIPTVMCQSATYKSNRG
jgi:hypothetical protein